MAQDTDRAIVVGIGRYPKFGADGNSSNDLAGPVYDATEMSKWFANSAGAHVTLVTSDGKDAAGWAVTDVRPQRGDIEGELTRIIGDGLQQAQANKSSRLGRRLYIYMAGHGFAPQPRSLSIITAEALGDLFLPNIEATAWVDWFAEQLYFDEFVLWMDCCATRAFQYPSGKPLLKASAARQAGRAKVFMGFAARPMEFAYEAPVGPGGQVRGLFTERLLRGLQGGAADSSGIVRTEGLVSYLKNGTDVVGEDVVTTSGAHALLEPAFPEQDDLVLAAIGNALPEYYLKVPVVDGTVVEIRDGTLQVIASTVANDGVIAVRLGVGVFKASGPGFQRLFEVASGTKRNVDLT